MAYLISVTETYRVETKDEADALIESAKTDEANYKYGLKKYNCEQKSRKVKIDGESEVEEWYRVSLTKTFTDEKEPETVYVPNYEVQEV